jgi:hypothetical protein
MARLKEHFGGWVEHLITQLAIEHLDDAPHAGLGAMFPTQSGRQRVFVEHLGALIWHRRRRCAHEGLTTPKRPARSIRSIIWAAA